MFDSVIVGKNAKSAESSPKLVPVSKVVINVSESTSYISGDDTGRVLEFTNPFGTQAMADDILARLRGVRYQPYKAESAEIDPAAEIGDAVTVNGIYGGLYSRKLNFGRLMKADISAPYEEEIDHEFKFETPERREFARSIDEVKASLILTNDQIRADVVKKTDGSAESFGWSLLSSGWSVNSGGQTVLKVDRNGLEVAGTIKAGTRIGADGGFVISASAIYNGISEFGGTQSRGVYLGTNGIQLGQNFKVDSSGNVTASNMVLSGRLTVGGAVITAADLRMGAQRANSGYQSWNGTTSTVNSNSGVWTTGGWAGIDWNNTKGESSSNWPNVYLGSATVRGAIGVGGVIQAYGGVCMNDSRGYPHTLSLGSIKDGDGATQYVITWA